MIRDLVLKNRSYRRFHENESIESRVLLDLVDLARLTPSSANLQPLKYVLSCTPDRNAMIFRHLSWAGYLRDWPGPSEGERPAGYVLILGDRTLSKNFSVDSGIAAQTILLGATELGLGGCMIGSIKRPELMTALILDGERFELLLAIALGKPKEEVMLEPMDAEHGVQYYRDEQQVHHVPKRSLGDIILA